MIWNAFNIYDVQGPVMFDESGDRRCLTQIEQFQGSIEVQVGVYNPASKLVNKITWHTSQPIYWKGRWSCIHDVA